jgi:hypothetical protein
MSARRGFGSVRRLPSGKWQARYRDADGTRFTAPGSFPHLTPIFHGARGSELGPSAEVPAW